MSRQRSLPGRADTVFLALAVGFVALRLFDVRPWDQSVDAYAYWRPIQGGSPYGGAAVGDLGSYLYSPAFKLLFVKPFKEASIDECRRDFISPASEVLCETYPQRGERGRLTAWRFVTGRSPHNVCCYFNCRCSSCLPPVAPIVRLPPAP